MRPEKAPLQNSRPLSVHEASSLLNGFLKNTPDLQLCIRGEISEKKLYPSGHLYFSILDCTGKDAKLSCVMWRSVVSRYREETQQLRNGQCADVTGRFHIYEKNGSCSFEVTSLRLSGQGKVLEELEKLRLRLQAEGLFSEERKKPLPRFVKTVGVATSDQGQAIQDICRTLKNRAPRIKIVLAPCLCQGEKADLSIISALKLLEKREDVDCIIVGRGGGSQADLQTYNSEALVRAVAACTKPTISAIGHEGDNSLVDFAADKRASTPTQAAEMLSDKDENLLKGLKHLQSQLVNAASRFLANSAANLQNRQNTLFSKTNYLLNEKALELKHLGERLDSCTPLRRLDARKQLLQSFRERLVHAGRSGLSVKSVRLQHYQSSFDQALRRLLPNLKNQLSLLQTRIEAVSPEKNFDRGYAVVCGAGGPLKDRLQELSPGDYVDIYLKGGCIKAEVKEIMLTDSPLAAFCERTENGAAR
ncbi:exodeoxyribonuclease VII large subunit [bacterium]|nr:exodeoxyribonuclease VII large subunit [bacterium]